MNTERPDVEEPMHTPRGLDRAHLEVGSSLGSSLVEEARHHRVRTFKPRRRRLSATRQALVDRLSPRWLIAAGDAPVDLGTVFDDGGPVVLDIGIGLGESCLTMAAAEAEINIIGVDVHTPGIATTLAAIDRDGLTNLRLFHGDVFDLVERLPCRRLAGIRAFFPDPWPKARHHRRRLITDDRLALLLERLADGGFVHVATDVADYAEQVLEVCGRCPELDGGIIGRPASRPVTRFETRGVEAGRQITDLWYRYRRSDGGARSRR